MKRSAYVLLAGMIVFAACQKKETTTGRIAEESRQVVTSDCYREMIAEREVMVDKTGIFLPVGTRMCMTSNELAISTLLPDGFAYFIASQVDKSLPVTATYTCICSVVGSACKVFFADSWGFGCLQSSCTGSCTGKFTYAGYTVDKVVQTSSRSDFFSMPEVKEAMLAKCKTVSMPAEGYVKLSVYGVSFFYVVSEAKFLTLAACKCEGTSGCTLKKLPVPGYNLYYCEGACNGCELTVK